MSEENSILYPENAVAGLFQKIPRHILITFISAFVLGLLVHMFMFTNKFVNLDDVGHLFGSNYGDASGRWLLPLVLRMDGSFSMPWLIGLISVILLAVSACFTVSIMKIRRPLGCVLCAAIMVTFPTVASTFAYMFSADAYFLSLALACFAAYITNKYRFGFLGGVLAITLSMGIYQSYFGIAALLMVAILIFDVLDKDMSVKSILFKGIKFLGTLLAGVLAYMLVVKLTTVETGLVNYMGISEMGKISVSQLPHLILKAYGEFYRFFVQDTVLAHFSLLKYVFALTGLATLCLGFLTIRKLRLSFGKIALLLVLVLVFPLACNIIYVMVPEAPVHILMIYGTFGILIAPLTLSERYMTIVPTDKGVRKYLSAACCWIIVGTLVLTSYSYAIYSNKLYFKMDLSYKQTYSYSTRLLSAIESTEGYRPDMPIVLLGSALHNVPELPNPELNQVGSIGVHDMKGLTNDYTYGHFLQRFVGAVNIIYPGGSEIAEKFAVLDEVKAMEFYPSADSIKIIDDYIIVKFSETPLEG